MSAKDPNDAGVLLYLAGVPTGLTYDDRRGATVTAETLGNAYAGMTVATVPTTIVLCGRSAALSIFVACNLDQATTIYVEVSARYTGDTDLNDWVPLYDFSNRNGTTLPEQSYTSSGSDILQTANALGTNELRVRAKADGAGLTADDWIKVALRWA